MCNMFQALIIIIITSFFFFFIFFVFVSRQEAIWNLSIGLSLVAVGESGEEDIKLMGPTITFIN